MDSDTLADLRDKEITLLNEYEARTVLREYGVPCPDEMFLPHEAGKTGTAYLDEFRAASDRPDFPLYCKVAAREITSISDVGGVSRVSSVDAFAETVDELLAAVAADEPSPTIQGIIAAADVSENARELLVGATEDPQFGTVVSLGIGGIYVEVYRDVEFRVPPIEEADIRRMLNRLEGRPILDEFRGMPPVDVDALVDTVLSFSSMIEANPAILEADINPLMAGPDGAVAADALIRLD